MPRVPTFFNKVNAIVKFVQNPCNAPWTIYFETALPAAGEAILTLLDFGFDDVVRGALRPRGLRSGRHLRRGRRGRRGGAGIPEIGELIGAALPGSQEAKGRKVTQGVKNLWLVDGVLQRILWYWLVVDVSVNFFYNWASAIQETEFCSSQGVGAALAISPDEVGFFSVANSFTTVPTNEVQYATGAADARFASHGNGGKPFTATTTIEATIVPPSVGFIEIRETGGNQFGQHIHQDSTDENGVHSIVVNSNSTGPPIKFSYRTNGGVFVGSAISSTMGL